MIILRSIFVVKWFYIYSGLHDKKWISFVFSVELGGGGLYHIFLFGWLKYGVWNVNRDINFHILLSSQSFFFFLFFLKQVRNLKGFVCKYFRNRNWFYYRTSRTWCRCVKNNAWWRKKLEHVFVVSHIE